MPPHMGQPAGQQSQNRWLRRARHHLLKRQDLALARGGGVIARCAGGDTSVFAGATLPPFGGPCTACDSAPCAPATNRYFKVRGPFSSSSSSHSSLPTRSRPSAIR